MDNKKVELDKYEKISLIFSAVAIFISILSFGYFIKEVHILSKELENYDKEISILISNNEKSGNVEAMYNGQYVDSMNGETSAYIYETTFTNTGGKTIFLDAYGYRRDDNKKIIFYEDKLDIEVVPGKKIYREYPIRKKLLPKDDKIQFFYIDTLGNEYSYKPFKPVVVDTRINN